MHHIACVIEHILKDNYNSLLIECVDMAKSSREDKKSVESGSMNMNFLTKKKIFHTSTTY